MEGVGFFGSGRGKRSPLASIRYTRRRTFPGEKDYCGEWVGEEWRGTIGYFSATSPPVLSEGGIMGDFCQKEESGPGDKMLESVSDSGLHPRKGGGSSCKYAAGKKKESSTTTKGKGVVHFRRGDKKAKKQSSKFPRGRQERKFKKTLHGEDIEWIKKRSTLSHRWEVSGKGGGREKTKASHIEKGVAWNVPLKNEKDSFLS